MAAGSTSRGLHLALAVALSATMGTALFASSHIRLVNEGSSGPLYECNMAACVPAQTDNPARKNLDQLDFYVLPDGCVALASAALRPDGPGIDVECGPPGASSRYRCESGSCLLLDPGTASVGAVTRSIALPAACGGRIHEVIVIGATTEAPAAFVECDASSGPVLNP
jgi:hypothetical protein